MSSDNGFLSQDEIDALLNGGGSNEPSKEPSFEGSAENVISENKEKPKVEHSSISDIEIDLLGEIGNISMGSASTALSTILGQPVNITTPTVEVTTLNEMRETFDVPNIALEVKYISGIMGGNLLVMKMTDAAVIADLMMGKDGKGIEEKKELSELEISAVSEAMNQMIGSAATSMATMFAREVNISPPTSKIWEDITSPLAEGISEDEDIIKVSFRMTIGDLVDSIIMQILPMGTAKKIVSIMMGQEEPEVKQPKPKQQAAAPVQTQATISSPVQAPQPQVQPKPAEMYYEPAYTAPVQPVNVHQASFQPLQQIAVHEGPKNIDLILDVPLEISVVLGKAKLSIKDVLALGTGSLVELDKLAEEPVEIHVNGKKVAYGEVVVVDENFGVRIVNIVSSEDRVKSLKG